MYLTVHGTAGIFIGSQVGNPWLAFLMGVVSHFVLDAIPHEPQEVEDWTKAGNKKKRFALVGGIDSIFLLVMLSVIYYTGSLEISWSIFAGLTGALLPDFIWAGADLFNIKNRWTRWYDYMHEKMHELIYKKIFIPWKLAVIIQIVLLGLFLWGYLK